MLTLFTVPKPFRGHIGLIQRNAIRSWQVTFPGSQVILFGSAEGVGDVAEELGVEHAPVVALSPLGAPLLDDVFGQAGRRSLHDTLCFANADIVFPVNLMPALNGVPSPFLVIGESFDADVTAPIPFDDPAWRDTIGRGAVSRGPFAIDYFFFSRGLFDGVPSFRIGRARYDNWLVWRALQHEATLVDGTRFLRAVHQHHGYGHLAGGFKESLRGGDALHNQSLAGLRCWLYLCSVQDAGFSLTPAGLQPRRHPWWVIRFVNHWRQRLGGQYQAVAGRTMPPSDGGPPVVPRDRPPPPGHQGP